MPLQPYQEDLRDRLAAHLTQVARERDPYFAQTGHFYVQQYIRSQLSQWGDVTDHDFTIKARVHQNLMLTLPGSQGDRPAILIGAHYDAVPNSPGADDNASGVAVLLELARFFSDCPARYPVQLVAFDLEEYGLQGSTDYAQWLHQQAVPLRLMLSLEMLGYCTQAPNSQQYPTPVLKQIYPDQGDFVALIGTLKTIGDLQHLSGYLQQAGASSQWLPAGLQGELLQATRLSDHAPFWDRHYPAILVTDTAFLRNPHYHQPSDRIETLDLDFMSRICQGLGEGIRGLR